jgi:hypothetical protein
MVFSVVDMYRWLIAAVISVIRVDESKVSPIPEVHKLSKNSESNSKF